jgi:asparagine synthase (glutamine-hydrolysing)
MCGFLVYSGNSSDFESFDTEFQAGLQKIAHRGPDDCRVVKSENVVMGFHRLSIIDLSKSGNQPFQNKHSTLVCNGEVYNYEELKKDHAEFDFQSESDCEVIIPCYEKWGLEKTAQMLDAEYSFVLYDEKSKTLVAARDAIGIRPMFYGFHKVTGKIAFASEVKSLIHFCKDIEAFPPGHIYDGEKFKAYCDLTTQENFHGEKVSDVLDGIHDKLVAGVKKRLIADAPVGYLLSGGLDSSLVCSIAQRFSKEPIKTFAIGMSGDAIDLKYARDVADFIGSDHTEVIIRKDDVLKAIREVVYHLESWDITTVRASIGMYLICKYIKEKTSIKVLMSGEVSDELFGYKYTDFAPSPEEFQKEAKKRIDELFIYDVLRADRCISAHSLEARVPFSDKDFVEYVMKIDPKLKMNSYNEGKYLLRKAFEAGEYLPQHILYRAKAAFSDAVGHSMVDYLKEYAQEIYTTNEVESAKVKYRHGTPFTKESLMYRDLFEEFYPGLGKLIKSFWMPNDAWENCKVDDPSARVLPNYGASGS